MFSEEAEPCELQMWLSFLSFFLFTWYRILNPVDLFHLAPSPGEVHCHFA
jgi:hypothetical protein